jgi:hypothetical protein
MVTTSEKTIKKYDDLLLKANSKKIESSEILPYLVELARDLGDNDLEKWARLEMYGYTKDNPAFDKDTEIPSYRVLEGVYSNKSGKFAHGAENKINEFFERVDALEELYATKKMVRLGEDERDDLLVTYYLTFYPDQIGDILRKIRSIIRDRLLDLKPIITQVGVKGTNPIVTTGVLESSTDHGRKDHDVFISHSSEDREKAYKLCDFLESKGFKCWISPRDTLGGATFGGDIVNAIDHSHVLVLLLSSHSNSSKMVLREVVHADEGNTQIIPYVIEKIPLSKDLKFYISLLHQIDATSQTYESSLEKLILDINIYKNQNERVNETTRALKTMTLESSKSSKCTLTGRVTINHVHEGLGKVGIGGAYVALVYANHPKSVCYEMVTDAYGYYRFSDIDITDQPGYYQIYANKSPYGDSYSNQFTLEDGKEMTVDVEVTTQPAKIHLLGENGNLNRDGTYSVDGAVSTIINAYVYDSLGNPVGDGGHVIFNLLNTSTDAGKLVSLTAKVSNDYMVGAFTKDGIAKVKYLWAKNGGTCKIYASCTEYIHVNGSLELKNNRRT